MVVAGCAAVATAGVVMAVTVLPTEVPLVAAGMLVGSRCWYESDGRGDVGADTWILGHEFGADAGEVGECGGELGLRGGPRCHAGLDLRGEVGVLAHAFHVAVGAAAGAGRSRLLRQRGRTSGQLLG